MTGDIMSLPAAWAGGAEGEVGGRTQGEGRDDKLQAQGLMPRSEVGIFSLLYHMVTTTQVIYQNK